MRNHIADGGGAPSVFALTSIMAICLASFVQRAHAQDIEEKWADSHGPTSSATAHDFSVGVMEANDIVYTAGTSVRSNGSHEFVVLRHSGSGTPPTLDEATWPDSPRAATAVVAARAADASYNNASLICVAGNEIRTGSTTNGYSQAVIATFGDHGSGFDAQWNYAYADDTPHIRHHSAVAIDTAYVGGKVRIAVLVRSHDYYYVENEVEIYVPNRYSVIVFESTGTAVAYNHVETFDVSHEVDYMPVIDMKMDGNHIWVLSQGYPVDSEIPVILRGFSHDDYSEHDLISTYFLEDHGIFPVRLRHVESTTSSSSDNQRVPGELVVVGYVLDVPPPLEPKSIITLRYGLSSSFSWELLWSEVYDGGGDDFPSDVAAVQVPVQSSFQSGTTPEHIFVVGSSEGANNTYDFTTILYTWDSSTVDEVWVARYGPPQEADDHAISVQATEQQIGSNLRIMAVVTGMRQNEYDEWDWLTVKYDNTPASGQPPVKATIWDILYPQNSSSSNSDDVPAAITIKKASGIIQAWVSGFFSRSSTGDDLEVVHYEEVFP